MIILAVFTSFNVVKNLKKPDLVARQKLPFYTTAGYDPTGNYVFKVNNRKTRTRCEICSKLAIKTPTFEHILHLVLRLLLLTLSW